MDKKKLQKLVNEMEQLNSNVFFVDKWVYGEMKNTIAKMREELTKPDAGLPESVKLRNDLLSKTR
jgi:hypothetical protein